MDSEVRILPPAFNNMIKKEKKILYLILIVSLLSFILILQNLSSFLLGNIDKQINSSVQQIQFPALVLLSKIVSNIFEPSFFILFFLVVIGILAYKKRKIEAVALLIFALLSFGLGQLIKIIVHRQRPLDALISEASFSFPSGHALMALVFFGALIYLFGHHVKSVKGKRLLTVLATLLILIISFSRIILNAHWFSDTLGSLALGTFLLTLFALIANRIGIFRKRS